MAAQTEYLLNKLIFWSCDFFFNWNITAVPSWNCLLCLVVVYSRAVIKISQASHSLHPAPCDAAGAAGRVRGQSWS